MLNNLNIVVQNVSLKEGMAGSMRVKNLFFPLLRKQNVTISNLAFVHSFEKNKIGENGIISNNVEYKYIGFTSAFNPFNVFTFYKEGFAFLKERVNTKAANILFHYGYPDIKNILFLVYARYLGYKVIFDIVEDNRVVHSFNNLLGWIRNKSSIFFINRIDLLSASIFVISKHLEIFISSKVKDPAKVVHIPISVNLDMFPSSNKWNPSQKMLKVFYGGSFFLGKDGLEYLIKAIIALKEEGILMTLYLSGKSSNPNELQKVLEMIAAHENIHYLGYLSEEEYFTTLNQSDIFCMPRNNSAMAHSGFPFKLGEFLATGKVVVVTDVGDVSLYLHDKDNALLIPPESVEELMDALRYCYFNVDKMQALGINARRTAESFFDGTMISNKVFSVLSRFLEK